MTHAMAITGVSVEVSWAWFFCTIVGRDDDGGDCGGRMLMESCWSCCDGTSGSKAC